jgi:hypothetical protein
MGINKNFKWPADRSGLSRFDFSAASIPIPLLPPFLCTTIPKIHLKQQRFYAAMAASCFKVACRAKSRAVMIVRPEDVT